jgi:hypothetical protein
MTERLTYPVLRRNLFGGGYLAEYQQDSMCFM